MMSSEKMGRFISELRKSSQMTQKDLAQKLNVTDKAVSKWERGLSYPDISLLSPLAKELGITAGELLNGEKDTENNADANIAIDHVLRYAEKAVETKTKSTRKRAVFAVVGAVLLFMGLSLIIGPAINRNMNTRAIRRVIMAYETEISRMVRAEIDEHFRRAEEFNAGLANLPRLAPLMIAHMATLPYDYTEILNVGGVIGRIEIPSINVSMPVFHGTGEAALSSGVGHMEGTSFPIGGNGTHAVIVDPSRLNRPDGLMALEANVDIGDYFYVYVLDRRLVYRVDSITVILPHEVDALRVIPDEDIVTLVTCTPPRVNSHRLLVRGTRVP